MQGVSKMDSLKKKQLREKKLAKALHSNIRKRREQMKARQESASPILSADEIETTFENGQTSSV